MRVIDYLEHAALHELEDNPLAAAENYEAAIASGAAPREAYVNLAVLYFVCMTVDMRHTTR